MSNFVANWFKTHRGPFGTACGVDGSIEATWVPDSVWTDECMAHDRCYSTCGNTKQQCDNAFFKTGAPIQSVLLQTVFIKASTQAYLNAQAKALCPVK